MKTREERIEFHMNYCQHYGRAEKGGGMECKAGMDLKTLQRIQTEPNGLKWGPCIGGHELEDPIAHCPHWQRRTRESAEAFADSVERSMTQMAASFKVISEWRQKPPRGKAEIIDCPVCEGGRLHLTQASRNGHVSAMCSTKGCLNFME